MAKKTTIKGIGKRALAIFLTLVMVTSLFNIGVLAAGGADEPAMVQNGADTYYKQDGSAGSASDWEIHLSKQAVETQTPNVYDINLTVETKDTSIELAVPTHGAVALVLDFSSSMAKDSGVCANCGKAESHSDHNRGKN